MGRLKRPWSNESELHYGPCLPETHRVVSDIGSAIQYKEVFF